MDTTPLAATAPLDLQPMLFDDFITEKLFPCRAVQRTLVQNPLLWNGQDPSGLMKWSYITLMVQFSMKSQSQTTPMPGVSGA
jgi:hypothetical protein